MSYLKFAGNVVVSKATVIAAAAINSANVLGFSGDLWVTSGNDSVHDKHSAHYTDEALDFRSKNLSPENKHLLVATIKSRLGKEYTVLLEDEGESNEHIHVQVAIAFRAK